MLRLRLGVLLVLLAACCSAVVVCAERRLDCDLLARFVEAEAGAQPLVCKVAVAAVVLNRATMPTYPHTIPGVVFQPGAFRTPPLGGLRRPPGRESRAAALIAVSGIDPSSGATKYWDPRRTLTRIRWHRRVVAVLGDYFFGI